MTVNARRGKWLYTRDWNRYFGDNARASIISKHLWPVLLDSANCQLHESASTEELASAAKRTRIMLAIEDSEEPYFL